MTRIVLVGDRFEQNDLEMAVRVSRGNRADTVYDRNVYDSIRQEPSEQDTAFLEAILPDPYTSKVNVTTQRWRCNSRAVGVHHQRLIHRNLIQAAGRGNVKFAHNYMRHFPSSGPSSAGELFDADGVMSAAFKSQRTAPLIGCLCGAFSDDHLAGPRRIAG